MKTAHSMFIPGPAGQLEALLAEPQANLQADCLYCLSSQSDAGTESL